MKQDEILYALTDVRAEYIEEAAPPRRRTLRRWMIAAVAASLTVLLMGAGVIFGDSVQSWMDWRWRWENGKTMSGDQTALVNSMSQEIGLSETIGDITVDVDSAIFGDQGFRVLVRVRGMQFDRKYAVGFRQALMELEPEPGDWLGQDVCFSGGRGTHTAGFDHDGSLLLFVGCYWDQPKRPETPVMVKISLSDLVYTWGSIGQNVEVIQEGTWEFEFPLEVTGVPEPITLPDCTVKTKKGEELELRNLRLCSTGLLFERMGEGDFWVTVILADGSSIRADLGTGDACWWDVPVDPAQVKELQIGETVITVQGD